MGYNDELASNAKFIYSRYLAIRKHFESDYDCWKYNMKVSKNFLSGIEKKKEFYVCVGLYNRYKKIETIEKLLVLNIFKNNKCWMGSLNHKLLNEFESFVQSSEYLFKEQTKDIFKDGKYNQRFNTSEKYPHSFVYEMYENGLLNTEILLILNMITGFLDLVYQKNPNDFIFEEEYQNLKKYQKFLENWEIFDIMRYKKIIKEFLTMNIIIN